jgi:glutamate--cysteine ligase
MIKQLKKLFSKDEILTGNYGIERELLRVDGNGDLSLNPHPKVYGNKLKNPYITTDFAESQVELVTPAFSKVEETYNFTNILYDIISMHDEEELLWPQSMPCIINEEDIKIAVFDDSEDGIEARSYREELIEKYGGKKQLISGIHYNFSFGDGFIEKIYYSKKRDLSLKDFKDQIYLKMIRNYLRYRWLIIYILGATPILHETYKSECDLKLEEIAKGVYSNKGVISFRNGHCGYRNTIDLFPDYSSIKSYLKSIRGFIDRGLIRDHKELYNPIRLKPRDKKNFDESLLKYGISYLEYRGIDINPFEKGGIALIDLYFLQIFNLFLLIKEESDYDKWQEEALENHYKIAEEGQRDVLLKKDGQDITKIQWALETLEEISRINKELNLGMENTLEVMTERIKDYSNTYAFKITQKIQEEGYREGHLNLAREYKEQSYKNRFKLEGFEDLELSTQILLKEAVKRGIEIQVLDRLENFISLEKDGRLEYVKQATKTSKDNYVSVLIMENKTITKKVLEKHNIRVPDGIEVSSLDELKINIKDIIDKPIVVKPKSTNFGLGINIFKDGASEEDILKAWEMASKFDNTILIEEFIKGKEYRFLVIDDKVSGILHRVPANVLGDGVSTIEELVEIKNQDPLRGYHYVTPLEKIKLDENAVLFLKLQNKNIKYIPKDGEIVYLRENSNISTGGDSIDYTEDIPERFKEIAIKSAKAVNAKFCGVDMMIEDYKNEDSDYGIIELNFNPAIHIHSYPYRGKERNIAVDILRALGFEIN